MTELQVFVELSKKNCDKHKFPVSCGLQFINRCPYFSQQNCAQACRTKYVLAPHPLFYPNVIDFLNISLIKCCMIRETFQMNKE